MTHVDSLTRPPCLPSSSYALYNDRGEEKNPKVFSTLTLFVIHSVCKYTCYQSKHHKTNSSGPLHIAFKSKRLLCRSRALSLFGIARECAIERSLAFLENNTSVQGHDVWNYCPPTRRKSLSEGGCTGALRGSVISGFRHGVNEIFALLGSYAA
jgi:hypothetical protein